MGTSGQTKDAEGTAGRKSRILSGILMTVIIVLGSVIWSLKANQIDDPAQDPNWVPRSELQQAQEELAQQKKATQEQQAKATQLRQKYSSLQGQMARKSSEAQNSIPLKRLPRDLRGDSVQACLDNILALQQQAQTPQTNQGGPIEAYFAILDHLQTHGVINTAEAAGDESRQSLYSHIQVALQSLDIEIQANDDLQKQTYDTVTRFQKNQKVKVDGKIGMQTFMAMVHQYQSSATADLQAQAVTR